MREHDGAILVGADDTYIIGPPEVAFECLYKHKTRLEKPGLQLNVNKTKCYIHEDYRNATYHDHRKEVTRRFYFIKYKSKITWHYNI